MFGWFSSKRKSDRDGSIPEIGKNTDLESLLNGDLVILFKHSPSCPVSWAACAHVERFRRRNPSVPIHMVSVVKDRAVSRQIAERTGVQHESPQVLVLRNGALVSVASHGEISAESIANMVATDQLLPR